MPFRRMSRFVLPILALFSSIAIGEEQEVFTESVVIFNTICAKCHEAQCSGRLSFEDTLEASRNHIVRHHRGASGKGRLQEELFAILNHMKEKCAYFPMEIRIPPHRVWGAEILEQLSTHLEKNYFVPMGWLPVGNYRLKLAMEKDEKITVHVVSESFAMIVEDCHQTQGQYLEIPFSVDDAGNHYVRVYPRKPVRLTQLEVVLQGPDTDAQ